MRINTILKNTLLTGAILCIALVSKINITIKINLTNSYPKDIYSLNSIITTQTANDFIEHIFYVSSSHDY